ncbi:MAG: toll/interleukin-1 receptor domain-containing protein, partial [Acetobacteraceae bacterium]
MARLFLSYGRRDGAEFADRLAADLTAAGHSPFLDRRALRLGHAWDETLAAALDEAEALLAVLTPHAVRRAGDGTADGQDSVCLDEIARARRIGKPVLPLMVLPCDPPLTLERAHYLDFTGWQGSEARYRARLEELLARLAGAEPAPAPLPAGTAWDFAPRIAEAAAGFTGRDWVFDRIAAWRDGADPRPLLILGEPGIGKSSLLAEFLRRDRGTRVLAAHFFQAELPATRDPARFTRDLAGVIAVGLPAYAAALRAPGL